MKMYSYQNVGNQDDFLLWEQFRSGDPRAMGKIFRTHYQALFKYGLALVKDDEMVEDSIQNLFEKLWFSRERLSSIVAIKPYLFKALRCHIIDQVKSARHQIQFASHFCEYYTVSSHEDLLISQQSQEEQRLRLLESLKMLSKRQRQAIYLKTFEELEYDKISEVMLLNPQSIRNLIHQAVKTLKGNRSQLSVF